MMLRPRRPNVVRSVDLVVERQGPVVDSAAEAVIAHFSDTPTVSQSLNELVRQFRLAGWRVVVASSCPARTPLVWAPDVAQEVTVLRKANIGYDFGSWAAALAWDGSAVERERVLLCNDSLVGPFSTMRPILDQVSGSAHDVVALTDSAQFVPHLQSYFLAFRGAVLNEAPIRRFWAGIQHHEDKKDVIWRNELGLSQLLRREAFATTALFPWDQVVPAGENPVIRGWRELLDRGFPFVKREILRSPEVAPAGESMPRTVRGLFGVEVEEWV